MASSLNLLAKQLPFDVAPLFQIRGVTIRLDDVVTEDANLETNAGRLSPKAILIDMSGQGKVRINQKSALQLADVCEASKFKDLVRKGEVQFPRALVRVTRKMTEKTDAQEKEGGRRRQVDQLDSRCCPRDLVRPRQSRHQVPTIRAPVHSVQPSPVEW